MFSGAYIFPNWPYVNVLSLIYAIEEHIRINCSRNKVSALLGVTLKHAPIESDGFYIKVSRDQNASWHSDCAEVGSDIQCDVSTKKLRLIIYLRNKVNKCAKP